MNETAMKNQTRNSESAAAKSRWGRLSKYALASLEKLVAEHSLSIFLGDLLYLNGNWYVTHSGLLRLAARDRCAGIRVLPVREFCDSNNNRWAFRATVYKSQLCK